MSTKIEEVESLIIQLAQLPEKDIELANRFKEKVITVIRTLLPTSEYRVVTASKIKFNDFGMVIEAKEDYMLRAWKKGISQLQLLLEEVRHELQLVQKYHEPKAQEESPSPTTNNIINVSGPFSGILQAGQENKATANEVRTEQESAVKKLVDENLETIKDLPWWKNFDRRIAIIGLIVAVIGLWFAIPKS